MSCGIYKFTSMTTGLSYIGQSIDIERRYKEHKRTDDGYSFHNAIKKYGWEDFSFEILEECKKNDLGERERYWVSYYNSYYNGYNETPGGEGSSYSGKKKPVVQYDLNGNFIAIYESALDAERKLNINSKASNISRVCLRQAYESNGFQWRFLKDVANKYNQNIGKSPLKEKLKEGCNKGHQNRIYNTKQVSQCDKKSHKIIKIFNSIKEASKETGVYFTNIYKVCKGERKSAGGYYWIDINNINLLNKKENKKMKVSVSENSLKVLNYLKENQGVNMTAADIAAALGFEKKSVDGIVTSGLQRKGYAERIPAEIEMEDGSHKQVKFIQATAEGLAYDHEAAVAQDAKAE